MNWKHQLKSRWQIDLAMSLTCSISQTWWAAWNCSESDYLGAAISGFIATVCAVCVYMNVDTALMQRDRATREERTRMYQEAKAMLEHAYKVLDQAASRGGAS